jgi:hypothetical protein
VVLYRNGRVFLHRGAWSTAGPMAGWGLPRHPIGAREAPPSALRHHLGRQLGIEVEIGGQAPDFHLTTGNGDLSVWVVRSWRGEVNETGPEGQGASGWFAADEVSTLELADPRYLALLSAVLAGGRAKLTWSADGASVTKTLVPGVVVPHWASLLGTPREAAANELRVNRMFDRSPPPVRAPKLLSSRRGPSMTFEAVPGAPLGPKFPSALAPDDLSGTVALARALYSFRPRRRWFRKLHVHQRLALHCRSGLITKADAEALASLAARTRGNWAFAHGDITARNVLRDPAGNLALIDWEWAGLYPAGYDLAFLWFSLVQVPNGRARVEAVLPADSELGLLLSAAMVHLLHLQLWARTPNPLVDNLKETLGELLKAAQRANQEVVARSVTR